MPTHYGRIIAWEISVVYLYKEALNWIILPAFPILPFRLYLTFLFASCSDFFLSLFLSIFRNTKTRPLNDIDFLMTWISLILCQSVSCGN